jgi:septal ring factor EnvC (AmiA/AmiB activator)
LRRFAMMRVMMGKLGIMPGNKPVIIVAIAAMLVVFSTGCVRSGSYNALKKELDDVRLQYETEKIRAQDIKSENRKLKQEIAELDGKFRSWREQLARTEQEWKETRDDLLRVKIDKEQQRFGSRDQVLQSRFRLIPESTRPDPEPTLQSETQSVDVKRRLKELKGVVQQIQTLLEP